MFSFIKKALSKTTEALKENLISSRAISSTTIDKEDLECALLEADISYELVSEILGNLPANINRQMLDNALNNVIRGESYYDKLSLKPLETKPKVILIVGINGAGKTTTIAKLANRYQKAGNSVILGAGDTFRAAAISQLKLWGEKLNINVISSQMGHDPSAVCFDTIKSAIAKNMDYCIIDTAGRLHNNTNLTKELIKINETCAKALDGRDFYKFLVLDATTGTSTIEQARIFHDAINADGIIITKLDGTSKGGAVLEIMRNLKLPIIYIGVGENENDLIEFNDQAYIDTILDAIFQTTN